MKKYFRIIFSDFFFPFPSSSFFFAGSFFFHSHIFFLPRLRFAPFPQSFIIAEYRTRILYYTILPRGMNIVKRYMGWVYMARLYEFWGFFFLHEKFTQPEPNKCFSQNKECNVRDFPQN